MLPGNRSRSSLPAICLALLSGLVAARTGTSSLRLENDYYLVEVSPSHGVIARIRDKQRGLELLQEPRLADNFKLSLPIRRTFAWQSTEANYILGREQRLTSHRINDSKLALEWDAPLQSILGKRYNVSATMTIELVAGDVRFTFGIRNASKLEIGEVFYPILGGALGLGDTAEVRRQTQVVVPEALAVRTVSIFHTFANMSWLGVFGPEQFYSYPDNLSMPWLELNHPALNRSVYFGAHDPVARYKVIHLEMSPGIAPARADGNWPQPEELAGAPAGVKFCFVHFPYQPAGRDFQATPVVLRFHDGNWREGARTYGAWLAAQQDLNKPQADWLYHTPAFQQCDAAPFKEIPRWARSAVEAGVHSLLLNRWSTGGMGDAIPRFDPDPRLGTRNEFAEAIRQCHALGVQAAVVVNLPPVSQVAEVYRTEFHQYACQDRWGIPYTSLGVFEASPLTGGFGAGERRVWMNPGHPGLRRLLVGQMKMLAELGVDGIHVEDFFGQPLDFNPGLGRTPDRASWEGGLECLREILETCRSVQPAFALSTDIVWDRALGLSRVCSAEARDRCALSAAVPIWQGTFTVADDDAFGAINNALRYRGRMRVAPADNQPIGGPATAGIVGYLRTVLAARDILSHTLLDGDLMDADVVRVEGVSAVSVFRNAATGLHTAVLVNPRAAAMSVKFAGFDPTAPRPIRLWLPTQGTTNLTAPAQFEIPGRHLALLTEEDAAGRLPVLTQVPKPARNQRVVFDLASSEDLEGWSLTGGAFRVSAVPGLFTKPTLNSLAAAGETATGTALSPQFTIEPQSDHLEVLLQGGWSEDLNGRQTLALQFLDSAGGAVLLELLPPGTHELRVQRAPLDRLKGRTVRLRLVDENRNASYAWIGLRTLVLAGRPSAAQEGR